LLSQIIYYFCLFLLLCTAQPSPYLLRYDVTAGPFDGPILSGFGNSASVDGDLSVVGGPYQGTGFVRSYFASTGDEWVSGQVLIGEQENGYFGFSVGLVGAGMLVGAPGVFAPDNEIASGAAYFYQYDRIGATWSPLGSTIRGPQDLQAVNQEFGASVAVSRVFRVVVGAPGRNGGTGGIYVFEYPQGAATDWILEDSQDGSEVGDLFGTSVDISQIGNRVLVGAPGNEAGYVLIYEIGSGGQATLTQRLDGGEPGERFGASVRFLSSSGDTFLVGGDGYMNGSGVIRVYTLQQGQFVRLGEDIVGDVGDALGSVGSASGGQIDDKTYVLGGTATGTVKRLDYDEATRNFIQIYEPVETGFSNGITSLSSQGFEFFAAGGAGNDRTIFYETSIPETRPPSSPSTGLSQPPSPNTDFTQPPDATTSPSSFAPLDPTTTAPPVPPSSTSSPGTVTDEFSWRLNGGPFNGEPGSNFGTAVSITNSFMAAGATDGTGRVVAYSRINDEWSALQEIPGREQDSMFGFSTDMDPSDHSLVVGAPSTRGAGTSTVTGAAFYYQFDTAIAQYTQLGSEIRGDEDIFSANEFFGYSVATSNNEIVACGAPLSNERNVFEGGRVYTFRYNTAVNDWTPLQATSISGNQAGSNLGYSVDLSSDATFLLAGGPGRNSDSGYAVVYEWDGSRWALLSTLEAAADAERFGSSVLFLSPDGSVIAVGGPNYGSGRGVVRVYRRLQGSLLYTQLGPDIVGEAGDAIGGENRLAGSSSFIAAAASTPPPDSAASGVDAAAAVQVEVFASTASGAIRRYEYSSQSDSWIEKPPDALSVGVSNPSIGTAVLLSQGAEQSSATDVVVGGDNTVAVFTLQ